MNPPRTDHAPWLARWAEGRIAWHRTGPNPLLTRWWRTLGVAAGARVLVPLAGASDDVAWLLERGCHVDAVELAGQAIARFFDHRDWSADQRRIDGHRAWCRRRLRFIEADFMALDQRWHARYDAIYDRAALIALDSANRPGYVDQVSRLARTGAAQLLISLDYPAGWRKGPPFSVESEEVERLYRTRWALQRLGRHPENDTPVTETAYRLTRR